MGLRPNFVDFFVSYGSYHNNIINKVIHFIFVPTIAMTLIGMLLHVAPQFFHPPGYPNLEINACSIFMILLCMFYIFIDIPSGIVSTIFYMFLMVQANKSYQNAYITDNLDYHFRLNLILHILSWIIQFIGHAIEGRKPALLDNILQVFVAPDFIVIQWMFYLGYRNSDYRQAKKKIHNNINEFKYQSTGVSDDKTL